MDRPNHIEIALAKLHPHQWFTWTDSKNKIYANLRLTEKIGIDGNIVDNLITELPTEEVVNAKLLELQTAFDNHFPEYKQNRRRSYSPIGDQLDQLYHDIDDDKLGADAKTGTWYLAVKAIKDDNPK